jgi:hypothetical protein
MWDIYTKYKEQMFNKTHTSFCTWTIIQTNDKKTARLESIRHVLSQFDYDDKTKTKRIATFPKKYLYWISFFLILLCCELV